MPSYSDAYPAIQAHCLAIQTYLETADDDPKKEEHLAACRETQKAVSAMFDEELARYVTDVITIVTKLALYQIHRAPSDTLDKAFEQQLHDQANTMGFEERLVFRHASELTDRSDPTTTTLSASLGVFAETFFRALSAIIKRLFNPNAFKDYKNYLNDAWGFKHQEALKELDAIFREPKHSNITFPSGSIQKNPVDPLTYTYKSPATTVDHVSDKPVEQSKEEDPPAPSGPS